MGTLFTRPLVRISTFALALVAVVAALLAQVAPAQAGGVVSNCSSAADLKNKLSGGGLVTFNCGPTPVTIIITDSTGLVVPAGATIVDGGNRVTLSGNNNARVFYVGSGSSLTLTNIGVRFGFTGIGGGCLYVQGALALSNVTVTNCFGGVAAPGGALYVSSTGRAKVTDSRILSSTAATGGGIGSQGSLEILNSTLVSNTATSTDGGGVWALGNTLVRGSTFYSNSASSGYGGAIYNQGTLSVTNSLLGSNRAFEGGGGVQTYQGSTALLNVTLSGNRALYYGGGIMQSSGVLTLTNVILSRNIGSNSGGGLYIDGGTATLSHVTVFSNTSDSGGGIINKGSATLWNVILSDNQGLSGGGIENFNGTLRLNDVSLTGNRAPGGVGGGYKNVYGTAWLTNVTVSGNWADYGGGISNIGRTTLTNVTLSGNAAVHDGGGIQNLGALTLTNVTLSGNSAPFGGGLYQYGTTLTHTLRLKNSLIAHGAAGGNCYVLATSTTSITSLGHNLSDDDTCTSYLDQTGDWNDANANLGPLANNGGPTQTHIPFPPSPAIGGGLGCPPTDQRGVPRPQGVGCDLGAVEYVPGEKSPWLWLPLIRR